MSSLSSAWKSVSESIWAAKLCELRGRKFEYAAQILSLTHFQAKERLLAIYMSFSVCKLFSFSDRLNWRNNNTSSHEFSFKISAWPCHGIDTGENNVQVWQTVQVLYFGGKGALIYLFIYLFILLLNYVVANAFGIWNLGNTGKSVTNWIILLSAFYNEKKKKTTFSSRHLKLSGCPVPIFSYFLSLFLFSPIFKLKPPIFPIF